MDKAQLAEATADAANGDGGGQAVTAEDVERVLDALFGTVEHPGSLARALRGGQTVVVGSFGSFRGDGGGAAFRPGKALEEYLTGAVG
ncbi:hypothetical protein [Streptomyces sp. NPDC006997]|uniref:HU family DNA-binding protein n=1 Tax=Streptomyces sp. NPDC006997 TaxID=3155356 RepID=UPI0033CE42E0